MLCALGQFTHRGAVCTGAFTVTWQCVTTSSRYWELAVLFELMLLMVDTGQD